MMSAGVLTMAKRGRPKRAGREYVTVKLDKALAAKAKQLAVHMGTSQAEVISQLVEVPLDRAYLQMLRELEHKEEG